jgi:hypothetical protein
VFIETGCISVRSRNYLLNTPPQPCETFRSNEEIMSIKRERPPVVGTRVRVEPGDDIGIVASIEKEVIRGERLVMCSLVMEGPDKMRRREPIEKCHRFRDKMVLPNRPVQVEYGVRVVRISDQEVLWGPFWYGTNQKKAEKKQEVLANTTAVEMDVQVLEQTIRVMRARRGRYQFDEE